MNQHKLKRSLYPITIDDDNIKEIPKHYLSVKYQQEIYFRVFLEKA
ncbi:hypothetical protein SPLC1_S081060 [Arthrospira platensis C1]|uniref:Uncharacterized protein n=1 Tax=Limnospira maxima CS-328 TaxID=513049 RepID=B5VUN2_LIMMA|nr:hypothetical protein AmaxDRAFT_0013 [Limnospira maxima CS-328]EKD10432.1 hypothetical protein SPLC1_S081060 [Arthrospira platensis C1]UWU50770.1 hypothetical protein APLC1_5714 [Arthrospira platensis C1]